MHEGRHTLSIFDDDLDQLRATVSEMGGRVEASVRQAVTALLSGDTVAARLVVEADQIVDRLLAKVERDAMRMIALRMPVAGDLRDVIACLRIAGLIARMGDCAKNIGHRVPLTTACRTCEPMLLAAAMEADVSNMVTGALDAFVRRDADTARRVRDADDGVDEVYAGFFRCAVQHMRDEPDHVESAAHMLFVAQKLERIGDHATGIAQMVHFAVTAGPMPAEDRPFDDRPSGSEPPEATRPAAGEGDEGG